MARLNPYLSFQDKAEEALTFYQSVLGGELNISRFGDMPDSPEMPVPEADKNLVMHGQLDTPNGLCLMAADSGSVMPYVAPSAGMTVALTGGAEDMDYIRTAFEKLSDGGSDVMPFAPAPWGDRYGQLKDRYGISWMFDCGPV